MTARDPLGAAVAWLTHPLSVLGLALVVPRAQAKTLAVVAVCLTGGGFLLTKFTWYAAELASSVLTVVSGPSFVRADRTDLVVLPALALAWLAFRRAAERPVASHLASHLARLLRLLVLLPLALLGTAATSCVGDGPPPVVSKSPDGLVWLKTSGERGDPEYLSSVDGGLTFRPDSPADGLVDLPQDCWEDTCYRVVRGDLHVQQRIGGGEWTTAWRLDPGQRRDLISDDSGCGVHRGRFESQALVVVAQPDGYVVLVSNGDDGLVRRDVSGQWTRIGWGKGSPPPALSQGVLPVAA